jgi:hypothetical protein
MRKPILVVLGAAVTALVLVACGGGDSGGDSQDQDDITAAIESAATSGDPAACTSAQTQKFTEETTGQTGAAAVQQCEKDAKDTPADSVDVQNIEVDGDSATADAAVTGSFFDGQTLELALVKEGDQWKLDEATGFKDFDKAAFENSFRQEISSDPQGAPPGAVDCVIQNINGLSDTQIEAVFLKSDKQLEDQVFAPCFKGE